MDEKPLVSVCCITYNHGPYIRQCLDGFIMQKTSFSFEVLIHDDASTDETQEIIKEYQTKFPEVVKPIIQSENQYSKGLRGINIHFNFPRAQGKYIAMCEGDDYWTDPNKLQRQVDVLEANPSLSLACGGFKEINASLGFEGLNIIFDKNLFPNYSEQGFEFSLSDLSKAWLTKTLTVVFRKDFLDIDTLLNYRYIRDVQLFHSLMKKGNGFYITHQLGVYNIHAGGVHSLKSKRAKLDTAYRLFREMHNLDRDSFTKTKLYKKSLEKLRLESQLSIYPMFIIKNFRAIFDATTTAASLKDILRVMRAVLLRK